MSSPASLPSDESITTHHTAEALLDLQGLAAASGVSARTIRYYQAERLLPAPLADPSDRRVARYGAEHLDRLADIARLRERGLKLTAIADLFADSDSGQPVTSWLEYRDHFRGWVDNRPDTVTVEEFERRIAGLPDGAVEVLVVANLIAFHDGVVAILSPTLLDVSIELMRLGMQPAMVIRTGALLRVHLAAAADGLVDMFEEVFDENAVEVDLGSLGDLFRRIAASAAGETFVQELDRATDEAFTRRGGPPAPG